MAMPVKILLTLLVLTAVILPLVAGSPQSVVFSDSHGESGSEMDMNDGSSDDSAMDKMNMDVTNTWQDQVNRISYPITAIVALFAAWVCFLLMRATGMADKFGLIAIGLALFFIQAVFGVLFYLSNGTIVTMPTLMFVMSLFNSLALLLIGSAFYRWKRMIGR